MPAIMVKPRIIPSITLVVPRSVASYQQAARMAYDMACRELGTEALGLIDVTPTQEGQRFTYRVL